jgi:hypothetical protein
MATKQGIVNRLLIAALSLSVAVIALSASSYAASTHVIVVNTPLPTENVGTGAATAVGARASQLVNLSCSIFPNKACVNQLTNNTFLVPAEQALVITDLQLEGRSTVGQGNYDSVTLSGGGTTGTWFFFQADAKGVLDGQVHLASGLVFPPGGNVYVSQTSPTVTGYVANVQGYLVPYR